MNIDNKYNENIMINILIRLIK